MKKTLFAISLAFLFSCGNALQKDRAGKDSTSVSSIPADSIDKAVKIDSAKKLLDSSNFYMAQAITKKMGKEEANKHIKPLMEKFQQVYKSLAVKDTPEVYQYRIEKLNEMIDLQVKHMEN